MEKEDKMVNMIKVFLIFSGTMVGWFFGSLDSLFYALIIFVLIDYITGVIVAFQQKKISSLIGFRGINKKMMIFVLVAMGNIIDQYVIRSGNTLKTMLIMFYLSNEGISIIENIGIMGVPIPKKLKNAVKKLQEK
jgi:toxin secretion/phage lysis holin